MMRLHLVVSHQPEGEIRVEYIGPDRLAARIALDTPSGVKTELFGFLQTTARKLFPDFVAEEKKPKK